MRRPLKGTYRPNEGEIVQIQNGHLNYCHGCIGIVDEYFQRDGKNWVVLTMDDGTNYTEYVSNITLHVDPKIAVSRLRARYRSKFMYFNGVYPIVDCTKELLKAEEMLGRELVPPGTPVQIVGPGYPFYVGAIGYVQEYTNADHPDDFMKLVTLTVGHKTIRDRWNHVTDWFVEPVMSPRDAAMRWMESLKQVPDMSGIIEKAQQRIITLP